MDRDLQKKVFALVFVRPAASTVFPNLVLRVKSLPTPAIDPAISHRSRPKIAQYKCPKATVGLKFDEVTGLHVDYLEI